MWCAWGQAPCLPGLSIRRSIRRMSRPDLSPLAVPGARIAVRATPRASRDRIEAGNGELRVYVTAPPDKGKANTAIRTLLARAIGVPKTRLRLVSGALSREKVFVLEPD